MTRCWQAQSHAIPLQITTGAMEEHHGYMHEDLYSIFSRKKRKIREWDRGDIGWRLTEVVRKGFWSRWRCGCPYQCCEYHVLKYTDQLFSFSSSLAVFFPYLSMLQIKLRASHVLVLWSTPKPLLQLIHMLTVVNCTIYDFDVNTALTKKEAVFKKLRG